MCAAARETYEEFHQFCSRTRNVILTDNNSDYEWIGSHGVLIATIVNNVLVIPVYSTTDHIIPVMGNDITI